MSKNIFLFILGLLPSSSERLIVQYEHMQAENMGGLC